MKYLLCMLDTESYSEAWIKTCNTYDDAVTTAKRLLIEEEYAESENEIEEEKPDSSLLGNEGKLLRLSAGDCDDFEVAEIFELKENTTHCIVWHHAYAGVDFACKQFTSEAEAQACMLSEIEKIIEEDDDLEYSEYEPYEYGDCRWVYDSGEEWWVWDLYEVKEG